MMILGYSNAAVTLMGDASIETLQKELKELSKAANWPSVDPGDVDGNLGPNTIKAVASVIPHVTNWGSSTVGKVMEAALLATQVAGKLDSLKPVIQSNASYITHGVKALRYAYQGKNIIDGKDTGGPSAPSSVIVNGKVSWGATGAQWVQGQRTEFGHGAIAYYDKGDAKFHVAAAGGQGVKDATHHEVSVQTKVPTDVIFMSKYRYKTLTGTLPFYMKKNNLYIAGGLSVAAGLYVWLSK